MKQFPRYTTFAAVLFAVAVAGCDPVPGDLLVTNIHDPNAPQATQLAFRAISAPDARSNFTVEVEIQDAAGNLVAGATDNVTIDFANNAGRLLFHASGIDDLFGTDSLTTGIFLELVDVISQDVMVLSIDDGGRSEEYVGMNFDPATGSVIAVDRDCDVIDIDPSNGVGTVVDNHCSPSDTTATGNGEYYKAVTFESGTARLLAGERRGSSGGILYEMDPTTAVSTPLGQLFTNAGDSIDGFNGMAVDPTTGTIWALVHLAGDPGRVRCLVTIDPTTLVATIIGVTSENGVAAITFLADGSLYGLTGDGGDIEETLFTVDKTTAVMDSVMFLGHGDDGESLTYVPAELSGTLTAAAVGGVATFTVQISASAGGYTLSATSGALTGATSAAFGVGPS